MSSTRDGRTEPPPVRVAVVELTGPVPALGTDGSTCGRPYASARCLTLLDGQPLGTADLPLPRGGLTATDVASALERRFRSEIEEYLARSGRPVPAGLPVGGLRPSADPQRAATSRGAGPAVDATVVVATRDRPSELAACLRSVLAGDVVPRRLVVVDNAPSGTATAALVDRLAADDPRITYVREGRPGLAVAHNAALPYLGTTLVAFTDDDVVVHPAWLRRVVDAFSVADDVVCVTGMIAPAELETLPQQWIEARVGFTKGFARRVFDLDGHRPDDRLFPYTAGSLGSGANMAFRTDYLVAAGGFDEALGAGTVALGADDLAAFYDVMRSGHRLVYEPAAVVLHRHPRTDAALARQAFGYGVGLSAHLTRCMLTGARPWAEVPRAVPTGVRRAVAVTAAPSPRDLPPYPRALVARQWLGLLAGPWRYLRSRQVARRHLEPVGRHA